MDFQYNLISRNGILLIGYDVENLCIDFKCKRVNQCFTYFTRQITILTWILSRRPGIIPCIRKRKVHSRTSGCLPVRFVSCQKHI